MARPIVSRASCSRSVRISPSCCSASGAAVPPAAFDPRGSRTYGFFWRRRSYSLYRILGPGGRLIVHRFDVLEDVRLTETEVS